MLYLIGVIHTKNQCSIRTNEGKSNIKAHFGTFNYYYLETSIWNCSIRRHPNISRGYGYNFSNPLEQYWGENDKRTLNGRELSFTSTACYRGYIATWQIDNDSLFLVKLHDVGLKDYSYNIPFPEIVENFDLISEFGSNRVHAKWFTGTLRSQLGSVLYYVHDGYGSISEREQFFDINQGILINLADTNYIEFDKNRISPRPEFLTDTILYLVYNQMDTSKIASLHEDEHLQLIIWFGSNGEITRISLNLEEDSPSLSQLILDAANEALKEFPLLMKVNHEDYSPQLIRIWFNAHCLKHPEDIKYGCENYRNFLSLKKQETIEKEKIENRKRLLTYLSLSIVGLIAIIIIIRKKIRKLKISNG